MRALILALLAPVALASHAPVGRCDGDDVIALGIVEVTAGDPTATAYLHDRNAVQGNGIWLYLESSGIWTAQRSALGSSAGVFAGDVTAHNLQHGGSSIIVPEQREICVDDPRVAPDTLMLVV